MIHVLVLTNSAWDDTDAGNTFSNLLSGWEEAEISNLYMRDAPPNNGVCRHYFRITDRMLLKNLVTPGKIGESFTTEGEKAQRSPRTTAAQAKEKKIISLIHKYNFRFAYMAENCLWQLKGWQNENLDSFLRERKPDILFTFAIPSVPRLMLQQYIKARTGAKIVLFLVDHVCRDCLSGDGKRGQKAAERMRKMIAQADKIYAISEQLRDVYAKEFDCEISLLRKGCCFAYPVKKTVGDPVRITYAGNLLYGRAEMLQKLAQAISRINQNGQKALLDIYSGTPVGKAETQKLTIDSASVFHGMRPFEEVKQILHRSDVVLHVESFDADQKKQVQYSFSTKITDALESGSAFLVVGPASIASVEYPRIIPGVFVIDEIGRIEESLREFLSDRNAIAERAQQIRSYAVCNHSITDLHNRFRNDLKSLCTNAYENQSCRKHCDMAGFYGQACQENRL